MNSNGNGFVADNKHEAACKRWTFGFYRRGEEALHATRQANQQHQFLTVEMAYDFLRRHLSPFVTSLHPLVRDVVSGQSGKSAVAPTTRVTSRKQQLLASLRAAPGRSMAQSGWDPPKALELAAGLL